SERPGNYRVNAGFSLEGNDMPSGEWTLSGTGDLQHLSIERLNGRTLDGTVAGNGVLVWSPAWRWDATLTMEHINPGKHLPDWPGELSARVKVAGEALEETHRLSLLVEQLDGTLRGYRVAGHADLLMQDGALTVQRLRVNSGKNTLTASGTLAERWDMNARLDAPDLAALLPAWSGGLAATATIGGGAASPRIDAQLNGRTIAGPAVSLQTLQGDLALAAADTATQSASVHAGGLTLAGRDLEELQLDFSGTWQQHRLTLAAQGGEQQLDMRFNGGWRQQHWQGKLEQARWYLPQTGEWSLHQPVPLTLGPRRLEWADTCLTHERAELCIEAGGNPQGTLETAARLVRFPLTVLEEALDTPLQLTNLLDARLTASLQGGRVQGADLVVDVGAGDIRYRDLSLPAESRLEKGTLRASLDGKGVSATLRLELAGSDHLDAGLELPGYHPQTTAWRQQPLALEIAGDLKDLLIVQYLLEDTGSFQGALNIALQGSGTLGDPRIAGGARLSEATLAIDRLGIVLRQLDLDLRSRDDGLSLTGSAVSGEGRVELTGEIAVNDIASWEANVGLRGNRFEVIHQPEALVLVSPELQAKITPLEIHLGGKLHVPFARLRPEDLDRQTGRSSDVVIVDAKTSVAQDERWRVYSDVHLSLGDDVEIDGLGLTGDLLGAMHLNDRPQQETRAQGTISIEQGTYEAYGRKLEIERGRLLFSGGPVDNPGLDFRASRTVRDVTAGVRVSGTLETPELTLFSDPAMSESDIISYISFGRPMAQIGDGDGSAASQGLIAGGNLLGGMVGSAVGLEELGVEEGDTAEDAAMVLGTYLSPQLYVRYRTGLYESINEFHVIYEFTRNWGIRTISSVDQASAELRFSFER
ncbi:MAG: translocation/assembly module TamB domain-containing protein, partial [Gammaproteobacteria bacterium]